MFGTVKYISTICNNTQLSLKVDLQQNSHYSYLVSKDSPCLTLLYRRCQICGNVITSS